MKTLKFFINMFFLLFFLFLFTFCVSADGGYFVEKIDYEEHVHLPSQKALVVWNGTHETLIVSSKVRSDDFSDLAWVIPVKSNTTPVVSAGDSSVFYDVAESFVEYEHSGKGEDDSSYLVCLSIVVAFIMVLILLIVAFFTGRITGITFVLLLVVFCIFLVVLSAFFVYSQVSMMGSDMSKNYGGVEVVDFQKVDIYDVATVKANNSSNFVNWLNDKGFNMSKSSESVISGYCSNNDFYFIVNWVNLSNKYSTESEIEDGKDLLKKGLATPLKIVFKSEKAFYPMKMTSIHDCETVVNVYVASKDHVSQDKGVLNKMKESYKPFSFEGESYVLTWFKFEGDSQDLIKDSYFS